MIKIVNFFESQSLLKSGLSVLIPPGYHTGRAKSQSLLKSGLSVLPPGYHTGRAKRWSQSLLKSGLSVQIKGYSSMIERLSLNPFLNQVFPYIKK